MKNRYSGLLPKIHLWTDLTLFNLSFFVSYAIRFWVVTDIFTGQYLNLLLVANLIWIFTIHISETYSFSRLSYHVNNQFAKFFRALIIHAAAVTACLYLFQLGEDFSRKQFLMTYIFFAILATASRIAAVFFLKVYRQAGYNYHRYAIVGKGQISELIRGFYMERKDLGFRFCGLFEFSGKGSSDLASLENMVHSEQLDYLYCCLSDLNDEQIREIIRLGERKKTQVRLVPDFRGFITNMATIEYHDMYPIIQVNTKPFSSINEQTFKRTFDLIFSSIVMLLGLPIFLVIMVLVKFSSPGPVFFRQKRCGRWGETFEIYKFRSMYADADKLGMQHSTGDGDPRITPIGKFLRKSRLDELPQFLNVLKGEMSVVGPRPLFQYDVDMLMEAEPHDFQRILTVKPGITSIGQIHVGYADSVAKNVERLKYDLQYLKSYSVLDDVQLILQTVQVMVLGRGR